MSVQEKVRALVREYEQLCEQHGFDFVSTELVIGVAESMDRRGTNMLDFIKESPQLALGYVVDASQYECEE